MTREEHVETIRTAIRAAEADGFRVEITNQCCGCSTMALEIGPEDVDWDDKVNVVILGERR